jgi:hypothetical protein
MQTLSCRNASLILTTVTNEDLETELRRYDHYIYIRGNATTHEWNHIVWVKVKLPATRHQGAWGRGGIAPTHSQPRH